MDRFIVRLMAPGQHHSGLRACVYDRLRKELLTGYAQEYACAAEQVALRLNAAEAAGTLGDVHDAVRVFSRAGALCDRADCCNGP